MLCCLQCRKVDYNSIMAWHKPTAELGVLLNTKRLHSRSPALNFILLTCKSFFPMNWMKQAGITEALHNFNIKVYTFLNRSFKEKLMSAPAGFSVVVFWLPLFKNNCWRFTSLQRELCLHSSKYVLVERNYAFSHKKSFSALLFYVCCLLQNKQDVFSRVAKQNGTVNLALKYINKRIS